MRTATVAETARFVPQHVVCVAAGESRLRLASDDRRRLESTQQVHLTPRQRDVLDCKLRLLLPLLAPNGCVWICWPKKASGVQTDITEDTIREIALPMGLVDVKVCAVDDTWSGLKLVIRAENRK